MLHLSLHSKELFHSNILGWLFETYPTEATVVLEGLVPRRDHQRAGDLVRRKYGYLDLVVELPGFAPAVIENKVFSLPDVEQLRRYAEGALEGLDDPSLILLSFTSPAWADDLFSVGDRQWRWLSYDDLAERIRAASARVRASTLPGSAFAADLLDHYAHLGTTLRRLAAVIGEPRDEDSVDLESSVLAHLRRIRLHDALSKARAGTLLDMPRHQIGDEVNGRAVSWKSDFTKGSVLIEAFVTNDRGDRVGWQLQGGQWRLAVITSVHTGRTDDLRALRHRYVAEHYSGWFDFTPVTDAAGSTAIPKAEVLGDFNRFNPDFAYRYRLVPGLAVAQLRALAASYQRRAAEFV
jgi:hypothetical protein